MAIGRMSWHENKPTLGELVVVLRQGRIVETGAHAALIARGGYYAQLHAAQWRGEDAAD